MKKILSLLLALMMLVGLLAACSGRTQPQGDGNAQPNQDQNQDDPQTEDNSDENDGTPDGGTRQPDPDKKKIVLGTMATFTDFTGFVPEMMAEWGYEVEIQTLDEPVIGNTALVEGSIDANFYQHVPYLDAYNEANGTDLHACEPYIIASMDSIVSKKYASLDEVPNGASIAVADDASNLSVNLEDLASLGWITLKEIPEGSNYTLFDIAENPKELEFVEVSMFSRFSALDDGVDLAMVFFSNTSQEKYQTNLLKLFDTEEVAYPVVVVVRDEDKDAQWVKDLMEAMTSDRQVEIIEGKNQPALQWKILFQ